MAIKKIVVMSRPTFAAFAENLRHPTAHMSTWYAISVYGLEGPVVHVDGLTFLRTHRNLGDYLGMQFDDVDSPLDGRIFTEAQGSTVIDYLDRIAEGLDGVLVVHCHAGISRSGAIGLFACKKYGLNEAEFHFNHPSIYPNRHVLKILNKMQQLKTPFDMEIL